MDGTTRTVDYLFTMLSPWAYIGHDALLAICRRRGAALRYKPIALSTVFPASGGLPLPRRHPSRQAYRLVELRRWRERRGLEFDLHPRFWPFDPTLADRAVTALAATGADPGGFVGAGFAAVWVGGRDLADPQQLAALLSGAGHDAGAVLAAARSEPMAEAYAAQTREAVAAGVFGSPSYVLDGEIFWGQDRLDLLDEALASGRPAYTAETLRRVARSPQRIGPAPAALPDGTPIV